MSSDSADGDPAGGPPDLRASNAEREVVARQLHDAVAEGRLTMTELDERLARLYRTVYVSELSDLTADLPAVPTQSPAPGRPAALSTSSSPAFPAVPSGRKRRGIAVLSGHDPRPPLHVAEQNSLAAVMGGVTWDLRDAIYEAPVCTITAWSVMGGVEVIVPDDVDVEITGGAFMGGTSQPSRARVPGARVTLRIRCWALMGSVDVSRPGD